MLWPLGDKNMIMQPPAQEEFVYCDNEQQKLPSELWKNCMPNCPFKEQDAKQKTQFLTSDINTRCSTENQQHYEIKATAYSRVRRTQVLQTKRLRIPTVHLGTMVTRRFTKIWVFCFLPTTSEPQPRL
jgi:hypothetical protein